MSKKIKITLIVILALMILWCMGICFVGESASSVSKNNKKTTYTDSKTVKPTAELC